MVEGKNIYAVRRKTERIVQDKMTTKIISSREIKR